TSTPTPAALTDFPRCTNRGCASGPAGGVGRCVTFSRHGEQRARFWRWLSLACVLSPSPLPGVRATENAADHVLLGTEIAASVAASPGGGSGTGPPDDPRSGPPLPQWC